MTDAEDGLLRPGALPQLSIASAAGNKALLDAVEKAGLGLGKAWNQKPKFLEESMDPNRVSNNHNSFLKFLVEFIDPQTHDISLQVQSSFRIPYHQFLQPITNLQVSNPIHKKKHDPHLLPIPLRHRSLPRRGNQKSRRRRRKKAQKKWFQKLGPKRLLLSWGSYFRGLPVRGWRLSNWQTWSMLRS